jgi:hypothetical protein
MSSPEQISILVRAYKAAWEFYFQPDRDTSVLECLARPALAQFLVDKTKEGITDEPSLAAAGLEFLFSLEDPPEYLEDLPEDPEDLEDLPEGMVAERADEAAFSWNVLHLENAAARFVAVSRIRSDFY